MTQSVIYVIRGDSTKHIQAVQIQRKCYKLLGWWAGWRNSLCLCLTLSTGWCFHCLYAACIHASPPLYKNSHQLTWCTENHRNSPLEDVTTSWFTSGSWGSILNHRGNHTSSLHDVGRLQQPTVGKREWEGKKEIEGGWGGGWAGR